MGMVGVEAEVKMSDEARGASDGADMAMIIRCLERQTKVLQDDHEALLLLVRRTEGVGSELRGLSNALQDIVRRQSELEQASERRRVTCAEIMHNLADRLAAIEHDATPLPKDLTPEELLALSPPRFSRRVIEPGNGNGCGDTRLSLGVSIVDGEILADDDDGDEEP